jgi:2-amino-4-hydroxy-6-hydroxymethyldihydropteridine diphosphokinase
MDQPPWAMNPAAKEILPCDLVVVALGSNLGDSKAILQAAISELRSQAGDVFVASSLWTTTPVDCPEGSPAFCNAVAAFPPSERTTPTAFLARLKRLERQYGRKPKKISNEPRPLDLDLIQYGRQTVQSPSLIVPHPRAHLRLFVLAPLAEILPGLILPGQTQTVLQLALSLPTSETVQRLA